MKEKFQIIQEIPNEDKQLLNEFFIWLKTISKKSHKLVLVIDGLDEFEQPKVCTKLFKKYPKQICVIFSARSDFTKMLSSKQKKKSELVQVPPLENEEKRQLVEAFLSLHSKKLSEKQMERVVEAKQTESPLFLKTVLEELCLSAVFETIDEMIGSFLECQDCQSLFEKLICRWNSSLNPPHKPHLVQTALSCIALSCNGLTQSELFGEQFFTKFNFLPSQIECPLFS